MNVGTPAVKLLGGITPSEGVQRLVQDAGATAKGGTKGSADHVVLRSEPFEGDIQSLRINTTPESDTFGEALHTVSRRPTVMDAPRTIAEQPLSSQDYPALLRGLSRAISRGAKDPGFFLAEASLLKRLNASTDAGLAKPMMERLSLPFGSIKDPDGAYRLILRVPGGDSARYLEVTFAPELEKIAHPNSNIQAAKFDVDQAVTVRPWQPGVEAAPGKPVEASIRQKLAEQLLKRERESVKALNGRLLHPSVDFILRAFERG